MTAVPKGPAQEILVATDFSDTGDAALDVAGQYARALHARLHLLHVFTEDVDTTRLLGDAAAAVGGDVPVLMAGIGGDPAEEILRYGTQHAIDLIVVGTHGRTGVSRVLLGSVAERVVRGARCAVLVVPARRQRAAPGPAAPAAAGGALDAEEAEPRAPARLCLVCATPTHDLICEPCRARIRGEALERKQREERPGRP
jgi:nucleotide-binding universal stress UspA family protein